MKEMKKIQNFFHYNLYTLVSKLNKLVPQDYEI